jgi:hypothetical protein
MRALLFLMAILATSCMTGLQDETELESRGEIAIFQGYTMEPGEAIDVQMYDYFAQSWVTIGETESTFDPTYNQGVTWYYWQAPIYLPRTKRFWPTSQNGASKVRSFANGSPLYVGTQEEWTCVAVQLGNGLGYVEAYQQCGSMKTEATIYGSCNQSKAYCFDPVSWGSPIADWPHNVENNISEEVQGVTNDGIHWYFATQDEIGRYGKSANLDGNATRVSNPFGQEFVYPQTRPKWGHYGDMSYDHISGRIFVALEVQNGTAAANALGSFDPSTFLNASSYSTVQLSGPQSQQGTFPWVARDPNSGYFFSSTFNPNRLERYKVTFNTSGVPTGIQHCGFIPMPPLERVQGGVFSESGRLYLSTDSQGSTAINKGLIKVFEMNGVHTGYDIDCNSPPTLPPLELVASLPLNKQPGAGTCDYEEVQGITIWPEVVGYGGRQLGDVHVILLNNDCFDDDNYWFKHFQLSNLLHL